LSNLLKPDLKLYCSTINLEIGCKILWILPPKVEHLGYTSNPELIFRIPPLVGQVQPEVREVLTEVTVIEPLQLSQVGSW